MLENVEVIVQEGGPSKLRFVDCLIDGVNFNIHENSQLELSRCYIPNLHISSSGEGRILMNECVYDKKLISLLENVEMNNCVSAEIDESIYIAYALAAVLGKFIHLNESHPETSMRKTNINEENIFTGLVVKYRDIAGTIVSALVNGGYLSKKPTGSVTRYDPTGNFNAFEGAKFIMSPHPEGVGDMTKDILSRIK